MDGMDELPAELATNFASELQTRSTNDNSANFVMTSRQAFYVARRGLLDRLGLSAIVHLLDLTDQDIWTYVTNLGLKVDRFLAALDEVDAYDDVRNPFILSVLAGRFSVVRTLGCLRSENVKFVIDRLIESRPRIDAHKQRRALRLLAVAIEAYSRNELSEDEAVRVIKASMRISTAEASDLLFELYGSILKRTAGGLAFQMRSYGEYLAAEELETAGLSRIRELAFMDFNTPNESWSNTITYLAELNSEVKAYFIRCRPFWMINASPAAFSEAERSAIASSVLQTLKKELQYLYHEPGLRVRRMTRFIIKAVEAELTQDLTSDIPVVKGNALALLGTLAARV